MITWAVLPVLASLALAVAGPRLGRALDGRTASILLTVSALTCALTTGLALCAAACLSLAEFPRFAALGHWSSAAIASQDPIPPLWAAGCGLLAAGLLAASVVRLAVSVRRLARSAAHCRRLAADAPSGLVVLDVAEPDAYALAGLPGTAVITRPMLRALTAPERAAVLAHENAHVDHYHFLYVHLTQLAATANPLLRPLVGTVRVAVERWADDAAADRVGDRRQVAATLARVALVKAEARRSAPRAGAERAPRWHGALAVAETALGQRVSALLEHRARRASTVAAGLLVALTLGCLLAGGAITLDSDHLLEWAQTR